MITTEEHVVVEQVTDALATDNYLFVREGKIVCTHTIQPPPQRKKRSKGI
jgi:hypothetical protein